MFASPPPEWPPDAGVAGALQPAAKRRGRRKVSRRARGREETRVGAVRVFTEVSLTETMIRRLCRRTRFQTAGGPRCTRLHSGAFAGANGIRTHDLGRCAALQRWCERECAVVA